MKKAIILLTIVSLSMVGFGCGNMSPEPTTTEGSLGAKARNWQERETPHQAKLPEILDAELFDKEETIFLLEEIVKEAPDMPYRTDKDQFGREDYWQTSREFADNNYTGDCEDICIFVYSLIRKAQIFADNDVAFRIVGKDGGTLHAILVVYSSEGPVYVDGRYVRHEGKDVYEDVIVEFNLFTIW